MSTRSPGQVRPGQARRGRPDLHSAPSVGESPAGTVRHGDLGYVSLEVTATAPARAFSGAALGRHFRSGRAEDGGGVDDITPDDRPRG